MITRLARLTMILLFLLTLVSCGGGSSGAAAFFWGLWTGTVTLTTTSEHPFCQLFIGDVEFIHQVNQDGQTVVIDDLDSPEDPPWIGTISEDGRSFLATSDYPRSWPIEGGSVSCQASETLLYLDLRANTVDVNSETEFVCTITDNMGTETVTCPLSGQGSGTRDPSSVL